MGKLKKLLINHGEKIGMAVVALIVLAGLAGADWVPYDSTPGAITQKVSEAEAKWVPAQWPPEEAAQFEIKPEDEPKAIVAAHIGNAMPLSEFMLTQKFARSPYEQTAPLKNPEWMKLDAPIANGGRVLLAVVDEDYQKEMELFQQGLGPDGKPLPAGTFPGAKKPMDDNIPDEFRQRPTQGVGGLGAEGVTPGMQPGGDAMSSAMPPGAAAGRNRRGRGAAGAAEAAMPGDPYAAGMMDGMGMPGAAGGGLPAGQTGRGFHYISVRAVFPLREQIYKIAEATNVQPTQGGMNLEILDYQIERQTKQESGDPWGGPWDPVDINTSTDVLTKMSVGLEPDVVYTSLTDPAMTMPLPARVSGQWMKDVTHPRIEKFTLTPEQIQQEVRFQQEALRRLDELKKELPPPPAQKGGWSTLVISGSQLTGAVMGGGAYGGGLGGMGGFSMPEMSMGGGIGAETGGMSTYGAGGSVGAPGTGKPAPKVKSIEELLNMKDKDLAKELADYVDKVVTAAGELLLFRYIDFSVEPGKTYRYRARLVFRNPNFGKSAEAAGGDTTVVTGETRTSDWCEPTAPESVQKDQQTFVTDVRSAPGTAFPTPQLNVFQWDPKLGSLQQAVLNVKLGQTISGKARIEVLDPAKASFETKEYAFQSTDYVVDAQPDVQIEASAHPDVKAAGGSRGDLMLPEQVLVALSEGGVSILDPSVSRAAEQASKKNLELQNEYWKKMKETQSAAGDPLAGAGGEAGVGVEGMYDGGFGMGGRGLSPLSNRGKKNRRAVAPMGP